MFVQMASKLAYYGAVLVILVFICVVGLSLLNSNPPVDVSPTPSVNPTAQLSSFNAVGNSSARILGFGNQVLVNCQSDGKTDLVSVIKNNSCVEDAFLKDSSFYPYSATISNASEANSCLFSIRASLADFCEANALKKAFLEFSSQVLLYDTTPNSTNVLTITQSDFSSFANSLETIGVPGYVYGFAKENDSIAVSLLYSAQNDQVSTLFIQQTSTEGATQFTKSAHTTGVVTSLKDSGLAFLSIPWEKRGSLDAEKIRRGLNSTSILNLTSFDYSQSFEVDVVGVGFSESNQSFFESQSFVQSVSFTHGSFKLLFKEGFTDKSRVYELLSEVNQSGIARPVFPNSTLSFNFLNNTRFGSASSFIKSVLPPEAIVYRKAVVSLNASKSSFEVGFLMPKQLESVPVFSQREVGDKVNLFVDAIYSDATPLQVKAVEE